MKLRLWRYEMTVTLRKRLSKAEEQAIHERVIHIGADAEPLFSRDALALVAAYAVDDEVGDANPDAWMPMWLIGANERLNRAARGDLHD